MKLNFFFSVFQSRNGKKRTFLCFFSDVLDILVAMKTIVLVVLISLNFPGLKGAKAREKEFGISSTALLWSCC